MQNLIIFSSTLIMMALLVSITAFIGSKFSRKLSVNQKKCWLIAHVIFVIVYFSGIFGTVVLTNLSGTIITDRSLVYAAHLFSRYHDWFLIIPGAIGSLLTGTWLSVRSNWGLTKNYWTIVKLLGNIGAILFGSTLMRIWYGELVDLSALNQINPLQNPAYIHNRQMLLLGTLISLGNLLFLVVISYFKPWGKRKYLSNKDVAI